jgi:DNA-binding MarR family transcriptional regulator
MDDRQLVRVLRNLFASTESKPKELTPTDIALTARLLLQRADECPVWPSLVTLQLELNCCESAITASIKRLTRVGWITKETGAKRHRSNRYLVVLDKLPVQVELRRAAVSADAQEIATRFLNAQRRWQPKRVFRKGTAQQYGYRFEALLKKCNGDKERLLAILNFAITHPTFKSHALAGPHKLRKTWRSLERAFLESQNQTKEQVA